MGTVIVSVMPKPEILDPQGQAVAQALPGLGFTQFTSVRQGKRFELRVDGPITPEILEAAKRAADTLLSNPTIEDVVAVRDATTVVGPGLGLLDEPIDWDEMPETWDEGATDVDLDLRHEARPTAAKPQVSGATAVAVEGAATGVYVGDDDEDDA